LLEIARRPGLSVTEEIAAAEAIYQRRPEDLDEQRQGSKALLEIARRPGLAVTEEIAAAEAIYRISDRDSDEQRQVGQLLHRFGHDGTVPVEQRLQIAREFLQAGTYGDRARAVHMVLDMMAGEAARQELAASWTSTHAEVMALQRGSYVNFSGSRVPTMELGFQIGALDAAEIPFVSELAQQAALPTRVRDQLYMLLRSLVPQFGRIGVQETASL